MQVFWVTSFMSVFFFGLDTTYPPDDTYCIILYHNVSTDSLRSWSQSCYFLFEPMTENRAAILVRLSPSLKLRLVEIAKRENRSLSKQVEFLLERCLESQSSVDVSLEARSSSGHPSDRVSNTLRKRAR
jgi:hypothetical protein